MEYANRNKGLRFYKYSVGQLVAVLKVTANKLDLRYEGPYVITQDIGGRGVSFMVAPHRSLEHKATAVHGSMLKPYHKRAVANRRTRSAAQEVVDLGDAMDRMEQEAEHDDPRFKSRTGTVYVDKEALQELQQRVDRDTHDARDILRIVDHRVNPAKRNHYYRLQLRGWRELTGWVPHSIVSKYWATDVLTAWRQDRAVEANAQEAKELMQGTRTCPNIRSEAARKPKGLDVYPLGTLVYKVFVDPHGEEREYQGSVTGYDKRRRWFRILYTDGDKEELTAKEVRKHSCPTELHQPGEDMEAAEEYAIDLWGNMLEDEE